MADKPQNRMFQWARMSGLFVREIVGWGFMLLGLSIFRISYRYLNFSLVIEGLVAALVGLVVFRAGLQLVKVSVAARAFRVKREVVLDEKNRDYRPA